MRLITDEAGVRVQRSHYLPYGDRSGALTVSEAGGPAQPESKGYIGERDDPDTGLLYLNARYMDPLLGRFIQPDWWDPTEEGVGTNRYAYAFNDPVNKSDPNGHEVGTPDYTLGGAAVGVSVGAAVGAAVGAGATASTGAGAIAAAAGAELGALGGGALGGLTGGALGAGVDGIEDLTGVAAGDWGWAIADAVKEGFYATGELLGIFSKSEDWEPTANRPPAGSRDIDKTPWSGHHGAIKGDIGASGDDDVKIDPDGNFWGENQDGSWTNHGPAENFIEKSQPSGQKGKDRKGPRNRGKKDGW
ncbi:RHS repeat-associated core domain-containing protein [Marinimicrococcus flavescens]|uniref:RHS repeat-associated core domain-containing protein n=1 Tax=Marinimicrococcus flavescens TaxID=3031815 RepID=A0AAP3V174_9PROT|nr:RHS repeat-associated core domain-containing protein [Marinimicrococcus flavescens]